MSIILRASVQIEKTCMRGAPNGSMQSHFMDVKKGKKTGLRRPAGNSPAAQIVPTVNGVKRSDSTQDETRGIYSRMFVASNASRLSGFHRTMPAQSAPHRRAAMIY